MKNKGLYHHLFKGIMPLFYNDKDVCHGKKHIDAVIKHALIINKRCGNVVDEDIIITACVMHDTGNRFDRDDHAAISARLVRDDSFIRMVFSEQEVELIADACVNHRASSGNPETMLAKIISDADRCDGIMDIDRMIERSYYFNNCVDNMHKHLYSKYGVGGYAKFHLEETDKMVGEAKYEIQRILGNKEEFVSYANKILGL